MVNLGYNKVEKAIKSFVDSVLLGNMPNAFSVNADGQMMQIHNDMPKETLISQMFGDRRKRVESVENRFYDVYVDKSFARNCYKFNFYAFIICGYELYGNVLFIKKETAEVQ